MTRSVTASQSDMGHDLFKGMAKSKTKTKERKQEKKAAAILVGEHGRYQIKSGQLAGEFIARAFPKPPTQSRGLIAEARGATEEAAIAALHDVIDARESRRTEERRTDSRTGSSVPSTEEYREAIGQIALSRPQRAMLMALSLAGEEGLTDARMAYAAGYKSQASANRSFASANLLIASYLSVETVSPGTETEGTYLLGFRAEPRDEEDPGNWVLHPELREAVRVAL
ncbi:hypothetical protein [Tropicimonas isoalkanivorans]|uniref:Uncharacterized protein n=1 Tax=Tropicimonas isoalkanivorans TaxID=441112 RepID=A0A1I1HRE8_9RHOB|nr:hypothetical protein [Tropicimonas isoalkanivorans]SFC26431.1 hypothetical protein SAMN04488094_103255 [Tropicimonas isoalkanivorans]